MLFVKTGFCLMAQLARFSFSLRFFFNPFRVEGRFHILRPPVSWSGALPFYLFGLASPSDPFCVSNKDVLSFLGEMVNKLAL